MKPLILEGRRFWEADYLIRSLLALFFLLLLFCTGCGGGGKSRQERAREAVQRNYRLLALALERESLTDALRLVSPDYLQDGATFEDFRDALRLLFASYDNLEADFFVEDVVFDAEDPEFALVTFRQRITGVNVQTRIREVIDDSVRELVWHKEGEEWKIFGNQEQAPPQAKSLLLKRWPSLLGRIKQ